MADVDFGVDISVLPDLAEDDSTLVSGLECLGQDLALRLDTPRGSLITDLDYGLDLRSYLNAAMTPRQLLEIFVNVKNELEKDDRVDSATVTGSFDSSSRKLTLAASVQTGAGPFLYTFIVSKDAVQVVQ